MSDKTALVVIDMQEDYLRDNRKKMFSYDADALVTSVNRAIAVYRERGCVGATAKGAVKAGLGVTMLADCIGRRFPEKKVQKMREKLRAFGVKYAELG